MLTFIQILDKIITNKHLNNIEKVVIAKVEEIRKEDHLKNHYFKKEEKKEANG